LSAIKKLFSGKIQNYRLDLVQIIMVMDTRLTTTPGVVAYVYGLLYENGINMQEEMSCSSDIMFVIEPTDLSRALDVLQLKN